MTLEMIRDRTLANDLFPGVKTLNEFLVSRADAKFIYLGLFQTARTGPGKNIKSLDITLIIRPPRWTMDEIVCTGYSAFNAAFSPLPIQFSLAKTAFIPDEIMTNRSSFLACGFHHARHNLRR